MITAKDFPAIVAYITGCITSDRDYVKQATSNNLKRAKSECFQLRNGKVSGCGMWWHNSSEDTVGNV